MPQVIGYALLNIFGKFNDPLEPAQDPGERVVLNEGNFQLPVILATPDRSQPLSVTSMPISSRLPCASLLVCIST